MEAYQCDAAGHLHQGPQLNRREMRAAALALTRDATFPILGGAPPASKKRGAIFCLNRTPATRQASSHSNQFEEVSMKQSRADIPGMQRQDPRAERLALPRVAVETSAFTLSTAQFGQMNGVKDQTVRWRLCMTGSYFGTQPRKLVNGRLAWPSVRIGNQ